MLLTPGTKLGQFEIASVLGKGGMGEVYRARDSKLGRDVAIKVMPEEIARDADYLKRFEQEAKVLASLDHPNVGAIYDFQHADGVHFLVMQLVEGETLSARIARGALSLREALPLFIQIARGLEAAHERGIVHRDLKPANIKVTPKGEVKVLDFGIAKDTTRGAVDHDAPTTPMTASPVTGDGLVVGTPQYMSPEQARGKPVDRRTDVWAFGCCLYEALVGSMPFHGETLTDIVTAIMRDEPDMSRLPALTPRVETILRRSLEKDQHARLSSLGDIAILLEEAQNSLKQDAGKTGGSSSSPARMPEGVGPKRSPVRTLASVSLVLFLIVGAFLTGTWQRPDASGGYSGRVEHSATPQIASLAVLPLDNLMEDPEQEYFVDGMTEALTAELSKIGALKVVSRTSVMRYKGSEKSAGEIATELGVEGLIEGSVMRIGDDVRITVQLIDAKDDRHLWAESYDNTLENVFRLHSEVAFAIAEQVEAQVTPREADRLAHAEVVDAQAHEDFLKGLHFYSQQTREGLSKSIEHLEKATARDPDFALAWAYLPRVLGDAAGWGFAPGEDMYAKSAAAAERAVKLAPDMAMARYGLGTARWHVHWDWTGAEREFQRALELAPNDGELRYNYAWMLLTIGRTDEAIERFAEGIELSPLSISILWSQSYALVTSRRYEEAIAVADAALQLEPDYGAALLAKGNALSAMGRHAEAIELLTRASRFLGGDNLSSKLAVAHIRAGNPEAGREVLSRMLANEDGLYQKDAHIGAVYAHLGESGRAFEYVTKAIDERQWSILELRTDPVWDPLRTDPRYWELIDRMKYPSLPPGNPIAVAERRYREAIAQHAERPIEKIAVLPFANLSGDSEQEYFVDGMTEALTMELARIDAMTVVSRTSAMQFRNVLRPMHEIAGELGADALVEGSVMRVDDRVRITAQLIDGRTDEHLWAERYDGTLDDILELQAKVALAIAREVSAAVTPEEEQQLTKARSVDPEAYEAYLRGMHFWHKRELHDAVPYFDTAIELAPDFAPAHSGRALVYTLLGSFGQIPRNEGFEKARQSAERALELDPDSPEAKVSLAWATGWNEWRWAEANEEFQAIQDSHPEFVPAFYWHGISLAVQGRQEEAYRKLDVAAALDPIAVPVTRLKVLVYFMGRRYEEAITIGENHLRVAPGDSQVVAVVARSYLALDRTDSARAFVRENPFNPDFGANGYLPYLELGMEAEGEAALQNLRELSETEYVSPGRLVSVLLGLGRIEEAVELIEQGYAENDSGISFIAVNPLYYPVTEDPRIQALAERYGL